MSFDGHSCTLGFVINSLLLNVLFSFFQVNGQKMSGKSQAEAVNVLRSTRGLVKILVQREEKIQSPRTPAIEVSSV